MAKTETEIKMKLRIPRIVMDIRNADPALLERMIPGLDNLNGRVTVFGEGAEELSHAFTLEDALENADIWVVFGKELPSDFDLVVKSGIIPVLLQGLHPKAENYDASAESGNAFIFPKLSEWHIYGTLIRAIENFGFTYDWKNLKSHVKELVV